MSNPLQVAGISLQLLAGFLFILRQVSDKFLSRIAQLAKRLLLWIAGEPKMTWKRALLLAPLLFIGFAAFALIGPERDQMTMSAVLGFLFMLFYGYTIYRLALRRVRRWYNTRRSASEPGAQEYRHFVLTVNVLFFVLSSIPWGLFFFVLYLYQHSSQNPLLEITLTVLALLMGFTAFPILFMSAGYLLVWMLMKSLSVAARLPAIVFWSFVLLLWTIGGAFMLTAAL